MVTCWHALQKGVFLYLVGGRMYKIIESPFRVGGGRGRHPIVSMEGMRSVVPPPPLALFVGRAWPRGAAQGTARAQARGRTRQSRGQPGRPGCLRVGIGGGGSGVRAEGGPQDPRAHFPRSSNTRAVVSLHIST